MQTTDKIQEHIESRLATAEPDVEVLLAEQIGAERVRLFIDHPDGVDLALCERVTGHLRELLEDYALEVSSPGPQRPLTKPDHFRRFIGRRAGAPAPPPPARPRPSTRGAAAAPHAERGRAARGGAR